MKPLAGGIESSPIPLSPELNEAACLMVASAVGAYPQSLGGAWIVADRVMQSYNPTSRRSISIADLAAMRPMETGERVTTMVNKMHERFNIPHVVTAPEMTSFVCGAALTALRHIREMAIFGARYLKHPIPPELAATDVITGYPVTFDSMRDLLIGPQSFNRAGVAALHAFVGRYEPVRVLTASEMHTGASTFRSKSKTQQRSASAPRRGILGRTPRA